MPWPNNAHPVQQNVTNSYRTLLLRGRPMNTKHHRSSPAAGLVVWVCLALGLGQAWAARSVLSLDGAWDIAEGSMSAVPANSIIACRCRGWWMRPTGFTEVGQKSALREVFWYRRTFQVKGPVPAVAMLKIHKAAYGSRVYLNGALLGEHLPSFTPGYFDARRALRGDGATNELVVRVGAWRDSVPATIPSGWDFEKVRYIPGIFDSVELIFSGTPHLARVQVAPDIPIKLSGSRWWCGMRARRPARG